MSENVKTLNEMLAASAPIDRLSESDSLIAIDANGNVRKKNIASDMVRVSIKKNNCWVRIGYSQSNSGEVLMFVLSSTFNNSIPYASLIIAALPSCNYIDAQKTSHARVLQTGLSVFPKARVLFKDQGGKSYFDIYMSNWNDFSIKFIHKGSFVVDVMQDASIPAGFISEEFNLYGG